MLKQNRSTKETTIQVRIGKTEAKNLLVESSEPSAALLVTAVDFEYMAEKHLEQYEDENGESIKTNDDELSDFFSYWSKNPEEPSLGQYLGVFDKIFNSSDWPSFKNITKTFWDKKREKLNDLNEVRKKIVHKRGSFRDLWAGRYDKYEMFDSEDDIEELIDEVYEFCQQCPAKLV